MADCEVAHSHHGSLLRSTGATRTMANLCSNSINDYARTLRLRVEKVAQVCSQQVENGTSSERSSSQKAEVSGTSGGNLKASALLVFRKAYISGQKKLGSEVKNWFSKDAWAEVKAAFASLPVETQASYQALADSCNTLRAESAKTKALADQFEFENSNSSGAAVKSAQSDLAICPVPAGPLNVLLGSLDFKELRDKMASLEEFVAHLAHQHQDLVSKCSKAPVNNVWPIDESNILSSLMGIRCAKKSLVECTQAFKYLDPPLGQFDFDF